MKKLITIMVFGIVALSVCAQQQSLYSQYMFNLFVVNPAYAGSRDALSANVGYRAQWVGFEGAPTTQSFSVHGPLRNKNMALGLQFQNDVIGARKAPMAAIAYAYSIRLGHTEKLSFGLQAGMINYRIDWKELTYNRPNDPIAYSTNPNRWIPNFDFGMMYTAPRSYLGLSASSLNRNRLAVNDMSDARLNTFVNLVAGKVFEMSEDLALKPALLVRYSLDGPVQADLSLGALFYNRFWFTSTYRLGFGMVTSAHVYITEKFHVGYSYDLALNNMATYQSGSHEVFLGYDFGIYRKGKTNRRYF